MHVTVVYVFYYYTDVLYVIKCVYNISTVSNLLNTLFQ
jgi:hypothetical protein